MHTLSKMGEAERDQLCQNVYEKYIFETSEFLESCDEIAKVLRTYIPSGCYTNFRDMLFHFRCLGNANEENMIFSQVASIIEHSKRAMRDAEVAICVRCVTVFRTLIAKYSLSRDAVEALEQQCEILQDCILRLRLGSMMLEGMDVLCPTNDEFLNMIEEFFECAKTYAAEEFKDVIEYAMELKKKFKSAIKDVFDSQGENELRNFKAFSTYNDVAEMVYGAVFGDSFS